MTRRPADAGSIDRALLRRGDPQEARAEIRRRRAVSDRPAGADDARRRAAGSRQRRDRSRAAPDRQAPRRLPQAGPQRARRGAPLEKFTHDRWTQPILAGDIVPAVVTFVVAQQRAARADRRPRGRAAQAAFAWTRSTSPADLFKVGDLIEVEVRARRAACPPS